VTTPAPQIRRRWRGWPPVHRRHVVSGSTDSMLDPQGLPLAPGLIQSATPPATAERVPV
jgi:hypothetical protein